MFNYKEDQLAELGAKITTQEIIQQPELWYETYEVFQKNQERSSYFMSQILPKNNLRVIFTGAGTSAYIGDAILPYIKEFGDEKRFDFQSVPTTTLLSNPHAYFKADIPTVLVSFARSGNSPESLASVKLGEQLVNDFYQIIITCAASGNLAQYVKDNTRCLLLLMPERSNDQGFAMTSSFTCMTLTALMLFDEKFSIQEKEEIVKLLCKMGDHVVNQFETIKEILSVTYDRIVYLGSGPLTGLAREVQLKVLELTAGKVTTVFDSPLGFRHGPKSFVTDSTLIFVFLSNQAYTRQYDIDMLNELYSDQITKNIVVFGVGSINFKGKTWPFDSIFLKIPDAYLSLPYAMIGQIIGLISAIKLKIIPDTPCSTGTVNRVVQGVKIYSLN
ncbi:SIS domain-containing protein [Atopobacter phocae]|uniref:SIS domain-containing protein n=1 Tax=Atopobacter phocae TaxID=136492 RepID=UPI00047213C9|nr:SIS domain-containing protein [Atopobacter phocae]